MPTRETVLEVKSSTLTWWLLVSATYRSLPPPLAQIPPGSLKLDRVKAGPRVFPAWPVPASVLHSFVFGSTTLILWNHTDQQKGDGIRLLRLFPIFTFDPKSTSERWF